MGSTIGGFPATPLTLGAMPMDMSGTAGLSGTVEMGLYTKELTQRHICGRRAITWDGRVFKYSKSGAACYSGQGASSHRLPAVNRTTIALDRDEGSTQVSIASQSFAKDELAGGYVTCFGVADQNTDVQHRGIIGNNYCSTGTLVIDMDAPLFADITTTLVALVSYNPYTDLRLNSGQEVGFTAILGVPAVYVSAASYYFWLQTWGPCFCAATEHLGDADGDQQMVFTSEGALRRIATARVEDHGYQVAGFLMTEGVAGVGWNEHIVMLQISI